MVRRATMQDKEITARLMRALWPDHSLEDMRKEAEGLLDDGQAFIALYEDQAFAQCSLRHDYVEGTTTSPVGYLEGIYTAPGIRGQGVARKLLEACMDWARDQGCREFASDCELGNDDSLAFHLAAGFTEANRIVCFTRTL
ncbi:MAG: GNAT family N-acetyltransferase [Clostridia bacterium]|nr:GNAT family N-acetyltransferase [Clostridia bacterium]